MSERFVKVTYKDQVLILDTIGAGIVEYGNVVFANKYHEQTQLKEAAFGDVLAPFPGRVENSKYQFEGKEYEMKNGWLDGNGHALHGFVLSSPWKIYVSDSTATCTLDTTGLYDSIGYPFSLLLQLTYSLSDQGLKVYTHAKNIGSTNAPFGIGFHPYFTTPSHFAQGKTINDLLLQIPAKSFIEYDDKLKPTGKLIPVQQVEEQFQYHAFRAIGETKLDNCYCDLITDEQGIAKTILKDAQSNEQVTIWQEAAAFPYVQVYSFDHSKHGVSRQGLAIEAESCCGFAANIPNLGLRVLKPNEFFEGSWGITL